jgi:hypothetical protein
MFCEPRVAGRREPRSAFELLCVGSGLSLSFILRATPATERTRYKRLWAN